MVGAARIMATGSIKRPDFSRRRQSRTQLIPRNFPIKFARGLIAWKVPLELRPARLPGGGQGGAGRHFEALLAVARRAKVGAADADPSCWWYVEEAGRQLVAEGVEQPRRQRADAYRRHFAAVGH